MWPFRRERGVSQQAAGERKRMGLKRLLKRLVERKTKQKKRPLTRGGVKG